MRKLRLVRVMLGLVALALVLGSAETLFSAADPVTVGEVKTGEFIDLPFLLWGGDVATFMANGSKDRTRETSLFGKQGLKFNLVRGDDFNAQIKAYLEGKTPFLRGTISQIGQASEVLGKDRRTKPVVFLQLTWSAGDHMVARPSIKQLNDLKGKKIALQEGGPHVGMLDDGLRRVKLGWEDVKVVWTRDVTGKDGPAELFRKDASIDACFVVTPDMLALTGGLDKEGDGSEKTVKGARVRLSTAEMSRSIADVYACRQDYFDRNKETVEKLTAAYLAACEELVPLRRNYEEPKDKQNRELLAQYKKVLGLTQEIYGKEDIPDEEAAHGLIMDAAFVGLTGNEVFFGSKTNPTSFFQRMKVAVDLAMDRGWAKVRNDPVAATLDYDRVQKLGSLKRAKSPEDTTGFDDSKIGESAANVIYSFTIQYAPNETTFPVEKYARDFERVIQDARLFGRARLVIRGHADITLALKTFVIAGLQTKQLKRVQVGNEFRYFLAEGNKQVDLTSTREVLALINQLNFKDADENPQNIVAAAQKLTEDRSQEAQRSLLEYAKSKGLPLNPNQFKTVGIGVLEPVMAKPRNEQEAGYNRRVEFQILRVSPEAVQKKDFDY